MGQGGSVLGEGWVKINLDDLKKLDLKVDDSGRKFTSQFGKMESQTQKLGRAFGALGGVLATVGVVKLGSDIISASTKMDTMNRMLVNIEGSQAKANKRFEQFRILAKEPVLDPFNLSKFYVQLKSVNVESELSIRFMKSLANAMAGVGASNTDFERAMTQFAQMAGQGKLLGQDLRVITESFPQIRKYLKEAFEGVSDPEILAKQGHTAIEIFTKLNEVMEKAPKFAGGAQAAQDNFRQSLVLFQGAIGKDVLPTFTKFLDGMTKLMDAFSAMPESTKNVIGKAVVGGLGILGIGAALSSVLIIAGQVKSALVGLGAINIASGGASVASAVASGSVAGVVAKQGFTIGTALMTIGKLSIVAGTVAMAYGVADRLKNSGVAIWGDTQASKDWVQQQVGEPQTFSEIAQDYKQDVKTNQEVSKNKYTSNMFVPAGFGKTYPVIPTVEQTKKLEQETEKAKEYAEAYQKFTDEINAMAYPPKPNPPDILGYDRGTPRSITELNLHKEQAMPILSKEYTPSMAGGVSALGLSDSREGLTSGLGLGTEVSKSAQEREKSMLHIQQIIDSTSLFNEDKVSSLADEWDGVTEEMSGGINKVGLKWDSFAMDMYSSIGGMTNMSSALLSLIQGYQNIQEKKRMWKESEMQLESRVSRGEISNEEAFWTQLSKSEFTKDIAFKKLHDMGVEGYATGGWVMKPTFAMVGEREPELIIPKSKMGQGGFGGNTHIEIHNINLPTMDRVSAENLVVNAITDARRHARI